MDDEIEALEEPVSAQMPAPTLYEFPHLTDGTDPIPAVFERAMIDADDARRLFEEKRYDQSAEKYLAVAAALLPEEASIGIYGGDFASVRGIAYRNAALAYRTAGLSAKGEERLSEIEDPRARADLSKALDLVSD